MKITRSEHDYSILFHEDGTLYIAVKADDEIVELEGMKGYLFYYSECVDEDDIDASPRLTLKEMQDYARECFNEWSISEDAIKALIEDLTPWFERFAVSDNERAMDEIRELEERITYRRKRIADCVKSIEKCREEMAEIEERIGRNTSEVADLNQDIEDMADQIARLRASVNGEKFISVEPCYTGGNIYVFTGHLADGNFFMADSTCYDVRVLDADPNIPVGMSDEDAEEEYGTTLEESAWASVEWQEEHLVEDLEPSKAVKFFKEMLDWVKANRPTGNYIYDDMKILAEDLENL